MIRSLLEWWCREIDALDAFRRRQSVRLQRREEWRKAQDAGDEWLRKDREWRQALERRK